MDRFFKKDLEVSGTVAEGSQTVEETLHLTVEIRGVGGRGIVWEDHANNCTFDYTRCVCRGWR